MADVTLCDVNVWLALALSRHCHHRTASEWFAGDAAGTLLFCRVTQLSLLRLLTTEAVLRPYGNDPLSNAAAWEIYGCFLANDRIRFEAVEPSETGSTLRRLAARNMASPKLWMDAYLSAFAIAGKYRLATFDSAFRQFDELDLVLLGPRQPGNARR